MHGISEGIAVPTEKHPAAFAAKLIYPVQSGNPRNPPRHRANIMAHFLRDRPVLTDSCWRLTQIARLEKVHRFKC
jgi:hypothetical protein